MTSAAFFFIAFSALMHALWNLLVKRSRDKTVFIWWMFLVAGALLNIAHLLDVRPFPAPSPKMLLLAMGGGLCFVLYHLFCGRAYRGGDLSLTYPLTQTSMLYVPLWGFFYFQEPLSTAGIAGILLVAFGTYCIQFRSFCGAEMLRPFLCLGNGSVQAALAAGFIYSFGAVIDKQGVSEYSPLHFTYVLVMFMFLFMSLNLMRPRYRGRVLEEWRLNRTQVLISGPVMMGSFLSFRYGLQLTPLSYALPLRQLSLLFGVSIGVLFLRERCGAIRLASVLIILLGIFFIRLG